MDGSEPSRSRIAALVFAILQKLPIPPAFLAELLTMKRSLIFAVLIQGSGTVLAFLTVIGIAHFLGAGNQGSFAIFKNWFDLSSAVLLCGAPQGVVFAINKQHMSPSFAIRMSAVYALCSIPVSFAITWIAVRLAYLPDRPDFWTIVAIAVGCGGYVYHGLARSVFLTRQDGWSFSALTIIPTAGIFLVVAAQWLFFQPAMSLVFPINGVLCAIVAAGFVLSIPATPIARSSLWKRVLFRQSAHSFVQSLFLTFQPLIVYSLLKAMGGGVHQVGVFSFALVALVAVNALIAMIAPILYNRWSKTMDAAAFAGLGRDMLKISTLTGGLLMIGLIVAAPVMTMLGGSEFGEAIPTIRILALASIPLVYARLWIPALLATGRASLATLSGFVRIAIAASVMFVCIKTGLPPILSAAFAWLTAEWGAALALYILLDKWPAKATALTNISEEEGEAISVGA